MQPLSKPQTLLYGIGNPGRQDDALGIMLIEDIQNWAGKNKLVHIHFDSNYQLNIEDAELIYSYDKIIFADASVEEIDSYKLEKVTPSLKTEFTMHSVDPSFVVGLCNNIFGKKPEAFQLHIKGHEWEFMKPPSHEALNNLERATAYMKEILLND